VPDSKPASSTGTSKEAAITTQPRTSAATSGGRRDESDVRVLVVDDEYFLAEMVGTALRYEGWKTAVATDPEQAIEQVRTFNPSLVVLDVMLPGIDGFTLFQRLRSLGCEAPVIFLTARDATEDRVRGLTLGATTTSPSRSAWRSSSRACAV